MKENYLEKRHFCEGDPLEDAYPSPCYEGDLLGKLPNHLGMLILVHFTKEIHLRILILVHFTKEIYLESSRTTSKCLSRSIL